MRAGDREPGALVAADGAGVERADAELHRRVAVRLADGFKRQRHERVSVPLSAEFRFYPDAELHAAKAIHDVEKAEQFSRIPHGKIRIFALRRVGDRPAARGAFRPIREIINGIFAAVVPRHGLARFFIRERSDGIKRKIRFGQKNSSSQTRRRSS